MTKFSESVKKYRKAKELTQEQLAQKLFVTKQAISKWETGRGYPDTSTLPTISKVLGISIDELMGEETIENKKSYFKGILTSIGITIILVVIVLTGFLVLRNIYDIQKEIKQIEEKINIDIPNHGTFVGTTFEDWAVYGNSIPFTTMSYIVFSNNSEISLFEDNIINSDKWSTTFSKELLVVVPKGLEAYTTIGDYYLLCNITKETFNVIPSDSSLNQYILLVYQKENERLIIIEYAIQKIGGNDEN